MQVLFLPYNALHRTHLALYMPLKSKPNLLQSCTLKQNKGIVHEQMKNKLSQQNCYSEFQKYFSLPSINLGRLLDSKKY